MRPLFTARGVSRYELVFYEAKHVELAVASSSSGFPGQLPRQICRVCLYRVRGIDQDGEKKRSK